VDAYVAALEDAYLFRRAPRFDMAKGTELSSNPVLYAADAALRRYLADSATQDLGASLAHIVHLELLARGYRVYTGKTSAGRIDFVAQGKKDRLYIQTAPSLAAEGILAQKAAALKKADGYYPRFVLTLDGKEDRDLDGIRIKDAAAWLLEDAGN